jgi:hypothetical protein
MIIAFARPEEGIGSLTVSNILFTGFLAAVVYSTSQNNLPQGVVVTVLTILLLDIVIAFPIFLLAATKRSAVFLSIWTAAFIMLRYCGTLAYHLWFWYHGLDEPNDRQCIEPRVFAFANVGAYGNVRTWYKICMTALSVMALIFVIRMALDVYGRVIHYRGPHRDRWRYNMPCDPTFEQDLTIEGLSEEQREEMRTLQRWVARILLPWLIIDIENCLLVGRTVYVHRLCIINFGHRIGDQMESP